MARPLRVEYPGAWYHVMNRGRRKERIFFDEKDHKLFLEVLEQTITLFGVEIHAYVLMPNHYHLFMKTPEGNISRAMRHLNGVYTQRFNKRHKMDGSLLRGRYKSILVEEETYMMELIRYIHRNPIKTGLEKDLGEYKWCSLRGYLRDRDRAEWLKTGVVLRKFSKYENEAKREFRAFISEEVPGNILKKLESVNWPAIMGGDDFKEKIKNFIKGKEINVLEMPEYRRNILNKAQKEKMVEKVLKNKSDILREKGTRRHALERRALIYLLRQEFNLTLKEIALQAGGVKYTAISNQYKNARKDISNKEGCYEEIKKIAEDLKWKMKI